MISRATLGDAAFAALGIVGCISGWQLGIGTLTAPESGLMPFLTGLALAVLGSASLLARGAVIGSGRQDDGEPRLFNTPRAWFLTMAAVIGLAVAVKYVAFAPATFVFVLLLHAAGRPGRIVASVVYAGLVSLAAWLTFSVWFGVSFR